MTAHRRLLPVLAAAALLLAAANDAAACACCTHRGQRNVGMQDFDSGKRAQVEEMVFQPAAELYVGEADYETVEGIAAAEGNYTLAVTRDAAALTFAFRGTAGAGGSLTLALPGRVSVFEVDTRDAPDSGMGPPLYKEWKLTGTVKGTGDFAAASAAGQRLTLILHGSGNSCTSSIDFAHWTLVMEGPKANYTLLGDLRQPEQ